MHGGITEIHGEKKEEIEGLFHASFPSFSLRSLHLRAFSVKLRVT